MFFPAKKNGSQCKAQKKSNKKHSFSDQKRKLCLFPPPPLKGSQKPPNFTTYPPTAEQAAQGFLRMGSGLKEANRMVLPYSSHMQKGPQETPKNSIQQNECSAKLLVSRGYILGKKLTVTSQQLNQRLEMLHLFGQESTASSLKQNKTKQNNTSTQVKSHLGCFQALWIWTAIIISYLSSVLSSSSRIGFKSSSTGTLLKLPVQTDFGSKTPVL